MGIEEKFDAPLAGLYRAMIPGERTRVFIEVKLPFLYSVRGLTKADAAKQALQPIRDYFMQRDVAFEEFLNLGVMSAYMNKEELTYIGKLKQVRGVNLDVGTGGTFF